MGENYTHSQENIPPHRPDPPANTSNVFITAGFISKFTEKAKSVVREVTNPHHSQFREWSSESLQELLITNNIHVRGSSGRASRETLIRICDEVFGYNHQVEDNVYQEHDDNYSPQETLNDDVESIATSRNDDYSKYKIPKKNYTIEDLSRMNKAASQIQQLFIAKRKRMYDQMCYEARQRQMIQANEDMESGRLILPDNLEDIDTEYDSGDGSSSSGLISTYADDSNDARSTNITKQLSKRQIYQENSSATKVTAQIDTPGPATTPLQEFEKELDDELIIDWRKPSWKFAKKYEASSRPHRAGKECRRYNWKKDTLGRYCTFGGCGEQLDLWNEGQISEFSQFGSGITNYFKFLKWCCWVMFILSILYLPTVVFNIFGASLQYDSITIAITSLGNLGSASNVHSVKIPGCNEDDYQFDNCTIKKDTLAYYYSFLDGCGTIIVIIAWVWLRVFEKKEDENLNRSTVNVSDYTACITNIPPDISEKEVAVHFATLTGEAVAEVNLAFNNADEIKSYSKRGQLVKERDRCIQRIRYELWLAREGKKSIGATKKRVRRLLRERNELTMLLGYQDEERVDTVKSTPNAIQAFVTFETENGFIKTISKYQLNWLRSSISCLYPKQLCLKGKKLKVSQAPEPSVILWENLQVSKWSRFCRRCLTTIIASSAIILSLYITFMAQDFKIEVVKNSSTDCPDFYFDLSDKEQYEMIQIDSSLTHCYCSSMSILQQWNESSCHGFLKSRLRSMGMGYGAGFIVCFMNIFFTYLMDSAGSFEKHQSIDAMERNVMARVFVLKFLNTGCLVLLYNQVWLQKLMGVTFEDAKNFNVDWYETGGVSVIIVMCINIISPHVFPFMKYRKHRRKIKRLESRLTETQETDDRFKVWYTQEDLNEVYLGPQFRLSYRYTQILITFYICWMYASSMPILPIIGTITFYVSFWVDKFLFCNFYRTPPKYSHDMERDCTALIGFGIILHIFMSCWILGNDEVFTGELYRGSYDTSTLRLRGIMLKKHILPLELIALTFIIGYLAKRVLQVFDFTLTKFLRCLLCLKSNNVKKLKSTMNTVHVKYSGARARGIIKGPPSYNILQNPKYQEKFAISSEFAMCHNRLCSIKGVNTKEGDLCRSDRSNKSRES